MACRTTLYAFFKDVTVHLFPPSIHSLYPKVSSMSYCCYTEVYVIFPMTMQVFILYLRILVVWPIPMCGSTYIYLGFSCILHVIFQKMQKCITTICNLSHHLILQDYWDSLYTCVPIFSFYIEWTLQLGTQKNPFKA